jgi:hypothetical protein
MYRSEGGVAQKKVLWLLINVATNVDQNKSRFCRENGYEVAPRAPRSYNFYIFG